MCFVGVWGGVVGFLWVFGVFWAFVVIELCC